MFPSRFTATSAKAAPSAFYVHGQDTVPNIGLDHQTVRQQNSVIGYRAVQQKGFQGYQKYHPNLYRITQLLMLAFVMNTAQNLQEEGILQKLRIRAG